MVENWLLPAQVGNVVEADSEGFPGRIRADDTQVLGDLLEVAIMVAFFVLAVIVLRLAKLLFELVF